MDFPELSVVIPVFNDALGLKAAVPKAVSVLESLNISFELIIAEDGSTDGTREGAESFAAADPRIFVNTGVDRRGKGGALSDAFAKARGTFLLFFDVDLSTDLSHVKEVIDRLNEGYDIVIGSRMIEGAEVKRSGNRELSSKTFNFLVRSLLKSSIRDHQCGFKGFRADAFGKILPHIRSRGWTWDTEVLSLAEKAGMSVLEIPVKWTQGAATNVRLPDYFAMGRDVLRLRKRLRHNEDVPDSC
ncbi:MAG TPA: glycosyltransferase [Methanocorpusculum sp.]|nr:glycosyltransferase [Methanocorpusculum sp.]